MSFMTQPGRSYAISTALCCLHKTALFNPVGNDTGHKYQELGSFGAILEAGYIHLIKLLLYVVKPLEELQSNTRKLLLKLYFEHSFHVTI